MAIPWHRFLKIGLRQLLSGTCFEVHDEFDLSDQVQRVDFAVIRVADRNLPMPATDHMPDGLQSLRDHNLISYKSMNEAFDHHALNELIGHAVAYAKLQAGDNWRTFSESVGLIALSTRNPSSAVISRLLHKTKNEDVYEIDCTGWKVTCVVINQAPIDDRNWLWELLRGERSRWKKGSISAILETIEQRLKKMGTLDPEIEAFESEIIKSWLQELTPAQRLLGLDLEKTDEVKELIEKSVEQAIEQVGEKKAMNIARKMILAGISDLEIADLTDLPLAKIKQLSEKIQKTD